MKKQPHVIFIGDSNMRLQRELLHKLLPLGQDNTTSSFLDKSTTTYLKTQDGVARHWNTIRDTLQDLAQPEYLATRSYYIVLNIGLHEIVQLCSLETITGLKTSNSHRGGDAGASANNTMLLDGEHCGQAYERLLRQLLDMVTAFPAQRIVWQGISAGWHKYGLFAAQWPADRPQRLPLDTSYCRYFNHLAHDIVASYNIDYRKSNNHDNDNNSIVFLDAYWLTLARPDHRDAREGNALGKRLVHPGPEVYRVLLRKLLDVVMEHECP